MNGVLTIKANSNRRNEKGVKGMNMNMNDITMNEIMMNGIIGDDE